VILVFWHQSQQQQLTELPNSRRTQNTHIFFPVAIETAGAWNRLVQEIGQGSTMTATNNEIMAA